MNALWLLALLGATDGGTPPAAGTVRTTVLIAGNVAGVELVSGGGAGPLSVHYEYNDRGRGPSLDERIWVGPAGVPTRIEVTGVDYLKAKVEERFERTGDTARWKNRAEQGEAKAPAAAFYLGVNGSPEEGRLLANALLRAPGRKLPLLPSGEASIEKVRELTITAGGKPVPVALYAISGLSFSPAPIWLSADGALAASVSTWNSLVPEGWAPSMPEMLRAQEQWMVERSATLARTLAHRAPALAVVHANLFDAERARSVPGTTVVVTGHTVTAVGKDGSVPIPKDAEVIDAAGQALLPGLWDMHVHVQATDGLLHVAAGVTSVRDLANDADELARAVKRFEEGTEIGPRVLVAGFIDGRGPYQGPTKVFADTEAEAKAAVEDYVRRGDVQIKVYSSLKPELVPVIARLAHERGLRLSGHVPMGLTAEQFVLAGADELQHMNFLFLNFLPRTIDTRTPARFTEVAAHGAEIDPSQPRVKAFIKVLQQHHTVVDPTVNFLEGMLTDRPGTMSLTYAAVADRMPVQVRRGFLYGGLEVPPGMDQRYRDSFQAMLKMTRALHDAGVTLVAGTDSLAGFSLHRE
ncbi:MAG TPA: hypothetical protein VND93_12800, partial [Myxococcales bacterium]|nr:hypothetical protein [Myxococcales bacterium]